MLAFNHTLAGSIIAIVTPAPLVPVVALASHFILDMTPHSGTSDTRYPYTKSFIALLVLDGVLSIGALVFAIWLFPAQWFIIAVGAFFSVFPDLLWPLEHHGPKWLDTFLAWANWIQWGERPNGWLFDVFYGLMMVMALAFLSA